MKKMVLQQSWMTFWDPVVDFLAKAIACAVAMMLETNDTAANATGRRRRRRREEEAAWWETALNLMALTTRGRLGTRSQNRTEIQLMMPLGRKHDALCKTKRKICLCEPCQAESP